MTLEKQLREILGLERKFRLLGSIDRSLIMYRRSLLITLNIFKVLIEECRRDLSLLSPPLMSSLDTALASLSSDLEVCAKVASVVSPSRTRYLNSNLTFHSSLLGQPSPTAIC